MEFVSASEAHFGEIAQLVSSPEELYSVCPSGTFPWDREQIRDIARERSELTVCMEDGQVVAFGNLYNIQPSQSAFIGNVLVRDSHKGKGIGRALLECLIAKCLDLYQATPCLSVFNYNTRALLLYTKLGFVPYSAEPRLSHEGQEVVLLHMHLRY
ncbi:GNAT family N-acetyltransferase [Photobacterium lutimaris]|uniref:GNAT family N-acetyltransferase n=1 Tax=Photobacterium lutimaris TaxID=388278 RepID=A0A2T3J4W9_9GAMM|nr:GNAT family N-acetyltransferase [Photobacterium lutimaris]PSU36337.1 GNAT family N-acetyltransferase [Photobacterium lutimaris]TDR74769.1 acetyltransferase (GNAT) family protein [Photobacterium lutimaris]